MPVTNAVQVAKPATPVAQPPVDCSPMRKDHPVMAFACDALVRTQTPRPATAKPVKPAEAPEVKRAEAPARGPIKLDARFLPMAMFGVGGPGLGLFLLNTGKLVPGLLAIGMGVLVASSIARSMVPAQK